VKEARKIGRSPRVRKTLERALVLLMLCLCGVLGALQYHWTGQVGQAEITRIRANTGDQARTFCQEVDAELARAYDALLPTAAEITVQGSETAHLGRLTDWQRRAARPIFSRIAVAIPSKEALRLYELDLDEAQWTPVAWPSNWMALRENLSHKAGGPKGPPDDRTRNTFENPSPPGGTTAERNDRWTNGPRGRYFDPTGRLVEFPVFARAGPELEWNIFELDLEYATNVWFPELLGRYLQFGSQRVHDVEIKLASSPETVLFSTSSNRAATAEKPVSVSFNPQFGFEHLRDPGKSGGRWKIEIRPRPGALEAIVASSQHRNLGLAMLLNTLMLAAGILLVRYAQRSREMAERQMQFVASVSHELRTPLTVIRGAGENLARGVAQEPQAIKDYSQLIIQHADQLGEMIEQVLVYAGVKRMATQSSQRPVSVLEILNNALSAVRSQAEASGCEVNLSIAPNLPAIMGNSSELQRAFQNLIGNAANHAGSGKWIGISAELSGDLSIIEVRVADHGPGIPPSEQAAIFNPFTRGARAEAEAVRGSGLGLALVREIVEAHGGNVAVRSTPGNGATFIVRLPVFLSASS
jgi:signal transduction histidine kinase